MSEYVCELKTSAAEIAAALLENQGEFIKCEEIVRCRDCANWCDGAMDGRRYSEPYCYAIGQLAYGALFEVHENDFCSWAERREP